MKIFETKNQKFDYTDEYIGYLFRRGYNYIKHLFDGNELSELALTNFKYSLQRHIKFTYDLWFLFQNCLIRNEKNINDHTTNVTYTVHKEAMTLMRRFICEKDIDNFLKISIVSANNPYGVILGDSIRYVFKSEELFFWLLKRHKQPSKYKDEFFRFYEALTTNENYAESGVPTSFFTTIPIDRKIEFD